MNRTIMISVCLFISLLVPVSFASAQIPSYAKWGKTAIEETTKKYPDQNVTDYRYDGKVFISDVREQYDFEFTLKKEDGQSREIRVYVLVNPKTDQVIDVKYDEIEEFQ
ncbi:DUF3889 domain-containing protein [Guptibacillus hwajinpoensis]|uniref:DUF3889 domain-containing protein n=1 Tax=Guptibacillus hwajinpoensis TaxID=208199 RepID=A0A0J6CRZ8_9BACL|nr:DUF3889 domain-containing protein [Alkalihalobacillus macyae]KMM39076.1 hypothetical protein AB986_07540 [Alkalihalobacillus macyae]MDP4550568.1 DUF3889 domain-containing protein [Alkalihalobacillus macyae]